MDDPVPNSADPFDPPQPESLLSGEPELPALPPVVGRAYPISPPPLPVRPFPYKKPDSRHANMREGGAWAGNPLSNPEDRALAKHRMASDVAKQVWLKRKAARPVVAEGEAAFVARAPRRPRAQKRTAKADVDYAGLRVWMQRFALWLAGQDQKPPISEMMREATRLCRMAVSRPVVKRLLARVDFQEYYEAMQQDVMQRAVAEYRELYPKMIQAQGVALDQAIESRDVRRVSKLIAEGMDRLIPRKREGDGAPREVHIHLGAGQQADRLLAAAVEPDDALVVELPPAPPEATDG